VFTARNLELRDDASEWARVGQALQVEVDDLLLIRQVHGRGVAIARKGRQGTWLRPEADVIISDDSRAAIGVRVADCAPILLADTRSGAVAAVHAGWRGTVRGAAVVAVEAMAREFAADPGDLIAAIGPCLGPCCGEVGVEVVQAFRDAGHGDADIARWLAPGASGRPHLDLWGANRDHLAAAGVPKANIHIAALCTKTHADTFHSFRAHGASAGRMVGVIRAAAGRWQAPGAR
jgi:YfiH family protein